MPYRFTLHRLTPKRLAPRRRLRSRARSRWHVPLIAALLLVGLLLPALSAAQTPTRVEEALLRTSNAGEFDTFGVPVAIDGDRAIVGAWSEDGPSDGLSGSGAAYVFERDASDTWTEVAVLRASSASSNDGFGV